MKYARIETEQDIDAESPRAWDNLGTMVCSHGRYTLGDEPFNADGYAGWEDLGESLQRTHKATVILPLYLYDHSGLSMYTTGDTTYRQHEAWDSGQVGFIYVSDEDIVKEYGEITVANLEHAEQQLRNEIATYSQYLEGDVWCVTAYDEDDEVIESLCGLYGQEAVDEYTKELKGELEVTNGKH